MSVLAYPRIHFEGRCVVDAATGNNYDAANVLDTDEVAIDLELAALSDQAAFSEMIKGRKDENDSDYMWCGWNYGGSLGLWFDAAKVTAVTGLDGLQHPDDGLVNQPVQLLDSAAKPGCKRPAGREADR